MTVNSKMLKAAILSISLGTLVNNSASVILGSMESDFPDVPRVTLQCFVTYPTLMVMLFTLIGGVLTTILSTKAVLLIGLVIFTVSGMLPMVLNNFNAMLVSRLCLGAGLGMVSPLSVSLITDFYEGEERVTLLGQQFAIGNMGQTASMLIVGFLAAISWRQTFWVYSVGAVVFVIALIFLPNNPPRKSELLEQKRRSRGKAEANATMRPQPAKTVYAKAQLQSGKWGDEFSRPQPGTRARIKIPCNWKVIGLGFVMFCYNTTYLTTYSNLALIMKQEGIGSATMVGYAMAFMTASGMCVGIFFGRLYQRFGNILGAVSAAAVGLAFFLMIHANSMAFIAISLIIMGSGNSLLMPFGYYHVSKAAPKESSSFSMSIVQAAVSAGSFCSPYIYGNAVRLLGQSSGRFTFVLAACVIAVGAAGLLVYGVRSRGRRFGKMLI